MMMADADAPVVLVLQHVAVEPPSAIAQSVERCGGRVQTVRIDLGEPIPTNLDGHSGLVVMGGPMGVYEADRHPHLVAEQRLIERALGVRMPILGVCLGSQLLASALGARVRPGPRKELGWVPVTLESGAKSDPVFQDVPDSFVPLHWHGDIFDLPAGATRLARSELTQNQAFSFGGHAYGLLFHMEATREQVAAMSAAFPDEIAQVGTTPKALMDGAADYGGALETLGAGVFDRWMALVNARSEDR